MLSTGGDLAAQQANLSTDFLLVLVGLILLFMTVIEYLGRRRELGAQLPDAGPETGAPRAALPQAVGVILAQPALDAGVLDERDLRRPASRASR